MADPGNPTEPVEREDLFRVGTREQRSRDLFHAVMIVLGAFAGGIVFSSVGSELLEGAEITQDGTPVAFHALNTVINYIGMIAVILWYLDWQEEFQLIELRSPTKRDIAVLLVGTTGLVALMVGLDSLLSAIGIEPAENAIIEVGDNNPELYLYLLPITFLFVAPAEELLFRGVVQGLLRRSYGIVPAVCGAAVLFGLPHFLALVGTGSSVAYVGITVLAGVVLGALYEYAGNFLVPWLAHAVWNSLVFATSYLNATGGL